MKNARAAVNQATAPSQLAQTMLSRYRTLLATTLRGLNNDIYFVIGLLTIIGLSAKNAIRIVEFANDMMVKKGKGLIEATPEAAHMRLRPILVTSLAFILGVLLWHYAVVPDLAHRTRSGLTS